MKEIFFVGLFLVSFVLGSLFWDIAIDLALKNYGKYRLCNGKYISYSKEEPLTTEVLYLAILDRLNKIEVSLRRYEFDCGDGIFIQLRDLPGYYKSLEGVSVESVNIPYIIER